MANCVFRRQVQRGGYLVFERAAAETQLRALRLPLFQKRRNLVEKLHAVLLKHNRVRALAQPSGCCPMSATFTPAASEARRPAAYAVVSAARALRLGTASRKRTTS